MASTITERVYDDLTHKLRQWEKTPPAPYEVLGAIKLWSQLGNADIEAAANAAAGLAVKATVLNDVLAYAEEIYDNAASIHTVLTRGDDVKPSRILDLAREMVVFSATSSGLSKLDRDTQRLVRNYAQNFVDVAKDAAHTNSSNDSGEMVRNARNIITIIKKAIPQPARSVKAFANVPDVPAALAHLRTAHAAIKAQVDAERSAPPRDGGFAGVKADDFVALRPDMDFHEYGRTVYQYAKLIESDPNPTSRLNKLNRLRAKLKKLNIGILGGDLPYLAKIAANAKRELRGAPPAPRVTKAADYEDTATLQSYVAQTITAIQRAYSAFNQSGQASIVGLRAPMLWIKLIAKELKDVDYGAPRYALERWHSVMKWGEMKITSKDPEWQRMLRVMQLCVDDMKFIQVKLGR